MLAAQLALLPPFLPAQLQVHGPLPLTPLAVPVLHKLVVGAVVKVLPLALPQTPLTGIGIRVKLKLTLQGAVMAPVVQTPGELVEPPFQLPCGQVPVTAVFLV